MEFSNYNELNSNAQQHQGTMCKEYTDLIVDCSKQAALQPMTPKFQSFESSLSNMVSSSTIKQPEFIDHTLLPAEYIRDSNAYLMDIIDQQVVFSKPVVPISANGPNTNTILVKSSSLSEANFPSSIFGFVNKPNQIDVTCPVANSETTEPTNTSLGMQPIDAVTNLYAAKNESNFMTLNADFLNTAPGVKDFCDDVNENREDQQVTQYASLSLLADSNLVLEPSKLIQSVDFMNSRSNSRKVLPHKKRISRKLKVNQGTDTTIQASFNQDIISEKESASIAMQFTCEICDYSTISQLNFFSHLKQHYEPPSESDLLSMKATQEAEEDINVSGKKINNEPSGNEVFNLSFEDFPNVEESVRNVINSGDDNELRTLNTTSIDRDIDFVSKSKESRLEIIVPDEVEFSDTEDMLEGIRNVVDKVSIEDSCDDILMPSDDIRHSWFSNNNFGGLGFKNKPFCDVSLSGQLHEILEGEIVNSANSVPLKIVEDLPINSSSHSFKHAVSSLEIIEQLSSDSRQSFKTTVDDSILHMTSEECLKEKNTYIIDSDKAIIFTELGEEEGSVANCDEHINTRFSKRAKQLSNINSLKKSINTIEELSCDSSIRGNNINDDIYEDDYELPDDQFELNDKKFICAKCNREFNSNNALKYHKRTHLGIRPHQCESCGKSFYTKSALKAHVRTHTGDKPYDCEHCQQKFRQWADLRYHVISKHTEDRNHQCEFCGKAFSRKYSLVLHRRIHTSERNYKCDVCEKSFRASTYLQDHRKIHTGEKPYTCQTCSKSFRVSGDLRRHQRIHQFPKTENKCKSKKNSALSTIINMKCE